MPLWDKYIHWLKAGVALAMDGDADSCTLFVGALPKDCEDEELYNAFAEFDPAAQVEVKRNEAYVSRGFGFVRFTNRTARDTAMSMRGSLSIRDKVIDMKEPRRPQGVEEVGVEREPRIGPVLVAAHDEPVREEAAGRGVDQ